MGNNRKHKKHSRRNLQQLHSAQSTGKPSHEEQAALEPIATAAQGTGPVTAWLNGLKQWQAISILILIGLAVFSFSLANGFVGDDFTQVVNNPVVHSATNIPILFQGSTFYTGNGITPLYGIYYRPLMMTFFSLIYTVFGLHAFYFHLFQLVVCVASAVFLYLFLRFSFSVTISLLLSAIFLIHPLNSQVVLAIASLQDALFFFFGILALYLLVRVSSTKGNIAVALLLFLSLLSKEAGFYFVAVTLLFLFWYDRKRLLPFLGYLSPPLIAYFTLKVNAVGLFGANPMNAPIDKLNLGERLLNAPQAIELYFTKMIFPWHLGAGYYWTYTDFSFTHVLLPLIIDLAFVAVFFYVGYCIKQKVDKATYYKYLFFGVWVCIGMFTSLHIIASDMTASETWFYFSMAGFLGMLGVALSTLASSKRQLEVTACILTCVIILFAVRTFARGFDWHSASTLAHHDVKTTAQNFHLQDVEGGTLNNQGKYQEAINSEKRSIAIWPTSSAYGTLCKSYYALGEYRAAKQACTKAMEFSDATDVQLYRNAAALSLKLDKPSVAEDFIKNELKIFPEDSDLWLDLSLAQYSGGDKIEAKKSISSSLLYGRNTRNTAVYDIILNNKPL